MYEAIDHILGYPRLAVPGETIGQSRQGRPLTAYRFGRGSCRISLLAGCHADEPVGPRLLGHLVSYLARLSPDHPWLQRFQWWIVPHANPDGEAVNRAWYSYLDAAYEPGRFLRHKVRELPGDDMEYGFPLAGQPDPAARPENQAIFRFWAQAGEPFDLHVSLHGMALSFGAWFLLEESWDHRLEPLKAACRARVAALGYPLYDVDRRGEKGFRRLGEGFCTRPDSRPMRAHFAQQPAVAARFRPSSMEAIRSLGGDCLTLVSEMPLFLYPRPADEDLAWPNRAFGQWTVRLAEWQDALQRGLLSEAAVNEAAWAAGLRPMPVADQLRLQWQLICAGIDAVLTA